MKIQVFLCLALIACGSFTWAQSSKNTPPKLRWTKLSTEYGDFELYNKGKDLIQSAAVAADFTGNGKDEFVIVEKTGSPSIFMYVHTEGKKWELYTIDKRKFNAAESIAKADIDGDGDLDIAIASADGPEIYWWENPAPNHSSNKQWKRNTIKSKGTGGFGDLIFGDFDNDQKLELAYWHDATQSLVIAQIPNDVAKSSEWPSEVIFTYGTSSQMQQRSNGTELINKPLNYHCGMFADDLNDDGTTNLLTAGMWFEFKNGKYVPNYIDLSYTNSRIISADLIPGGAKEVVMVSGNGIGPMVMYENKNGVWTATVIDATTRRAQSLVAIDFDKDRDIDIVSGELKTAEVPDPKVFILLNKGNGTFERIDLPNSIETHQTCVGDFDGDGDHDILGKPFTFDTPRIELWLNDVRK
jgi:hypothetical protein